MLKKYTKVTVGFVTQTFELQEVCNLTDAGSSKLFVCTDQEFVAGDQVDREVDGEPVDVDTSKETYQKLEMRATDHGDFVDDRWNITDVQDRYKDKHDEDDKDFEPLSDEVARKILHLCKDKMDANVGINWDTIDYWTDEVVYDRR